MFRHKRELKQYTYMYHPDQMVLPPTKQEPWIEALTEHKPWSEALLTHLLYLISPPKQTTPWADGMQTGHVTPDGTMSHADWFVFGPEHIQYMTLYMYMYYGHTYNTFTVFTTTTVCTINSGC